MRTSLSGSFLLLALLGCSSNVVTTGTTNNPVPPSTNVYAAYSQSFTVPYVGSPNFSNLTSTLKVNLRLGGGVEEAFTIDTGSVGMVAPAADVPNIPANSPAGSLTYSSSGLKLIGVWVTVPVVFVDATSEGGAAATASATVPVLAVQSSVCTGSGINSGSCTGTIPHQLGIGFGRGTEVQQSPVYNAALNLTDMAAGTMRRGYMLQRDGLHLGLTATNVSSNYVTQALTSAGTPAAGTHNDWVTPSGGFVVGAGSEVDGVVLMDTGLLDMFLEGPNVPTSGQPSSGTSVKILIGSHDYVFSVNDGGSATPTSVNYALDSHGAFVNTGLRAMGHYDILFDADGGLFGLWYLS